MNKFFKILIAIFGGVDTAFSLVLPMIVSLMLVTITAGNLSNLNMQIILIVGFFSSIGRALRQWIN